MRGGRHEHDAVGIVDLEEETPRSDAIAPGFWHVALQPADVRAVMGVTPQLRVNRLSQLVGDPSMTRSPKMLEIALELLGLEDPILSQRSVPDADGHRGSRPSSS